MKKVKIQKKLFWYIQVDLRGIRNNFLFGANSKSKIVANVDGAWASKDKMVSIWTTFKKPSETFWISLNPSEVWNPMEPSKNLKNNSLNSMKLSISSGTHWTSLKPTDTYGWQVLVISLLLTVHGMGLQKRFGNYMRVSGKA
jgi:hypothetical protein